jgi:hypothetical protein
MTPDKAPILKLLVLQIFLCKFELSFSFSFEKTSSVKDYQSTLNGDYNNHYDHYLIKRAINSFDDCFDFIDEPKYGFRQGYIYIIGCL